MEDDNNAAGQNDVKQLEERPQNDKTDDDMQEIQGWLQKRAKMTNKWRKNYFVLKSRHILYGKSPQRATKKIPLADSQLSEGNISGKDFVFQIKPKGTKRTFCLQASSLQEQQNWMQAICFAKASGSDKSEACVIQ